MWLIKQSEFGIIELNSTDNLSYFNYGEYACFKPIEIETFKNYKFQTQMTSHC